MYKLKLNEKILIVVSGIFIAFIFSYLFYESYIFFLIILLFIPFFYKKRKAVLVRKKKDLVSREFGDFCVAIDNCLKSGYSLENAYVIGLKEIKKIYGDKSLIYDNAVVVANKMKINIPIEIAFNEFANFTEIDEIIIFSEMVQIAKRSSGNISEIISKTVKNIKDSIEFKRQVNMIFASKKYEQMIMNVMPLLIIVYAKITSFGSIQVMYGTWIGRIIMTVCLCLYVVALKLSERIMETCKC